MPQEHAGHRQRMYEKISREDLLDWERMEVLLYPFQPRKNTFDLAHKLLRRFGSPAGVMMASIEDLKSVPGIGDSIASHLYLMGVTYRESFNRVYDPFVGCFHLEEFILRGADMYREEKCEVLDIYLLGENGRLLSRHRRTDEKEGRVRLDTKWLGKMLAEEGVYGVIMTHNHPDGMACHSESDEVATRACQMVCNVHGKVLCDHIIFSKSAAYSYYKEGKLQGISQEYSVNKMIEDKVKEERSQKASALLEEAKELLKREKQGAQS